MSRTPIGLRHAPCETQAGQQRTELADRRVDTLAEFARLESTDSAIRTLALWNSSRIT
jgi:hypothetical protein